MRVLIEPQVFPLRRWHASEGGARVERLRGSKFSGKGTLVQFPSRGARLARRHHLVWIDRYRARSRRRRTPHVLRRGPFVAIVVDVKVDDVLVRVHVIE